MRRHQCVHWWSPRTSRLAADASWRMLPSLLGYQTKRSRPKLRKVIIPRNVSLRMLFDHWFLHRRSLARIGTFGRMSDLFPISSILQETLGRWATHGLEENADEVTKHRIAIEIPYSFIVDTGERDEPIVLQGERDITIAESIRAGNEDS